MRVPDDHAESENRERFLFWETALVGEWSTVGQKGCLIGFEPRVVVAMVETFLCALG
jgi:hypothetical protein